MVVIQPNEMTWRQKWNARRRADDMYCLLRRLQMEDGSLPSSLNLPDHLDELIEKLVAQIDGRDPLFREGADVGRDLNG